MEAVEEVVIVGAGIAGLATALGLKKVGIDAVVLERADGLRVTGAALTLGGNAWVALEALGISHKLGHCYAPLQKSINTNVSNGRSKEVSLENAVGSRFQPKTVNRKHLLETLAEELPPNTIRFSSKITAIQSNTNNPHSSSHTTVLLEDGSQIITKVLIGCEGVHSVVARWLGLSDPVHSGRTAIRGLAEYPQGHGLRHEVRQFNDPGKRAGFVPTSDKQLYWFFVGRSTETVAELGPKNARPELIQREVLDDLAKEFPPLYRDVVEHSDVASLSWAPLMFRPPWNVVLGDLCRGGVTVAGDALHPMTPDLGQGGSMALEDAVVLVRHIGESLIRSGGTGTGTGRLVAPEAEVALRGYVKERRWRSAELITGSYLSGWAQQDGSSRWMKFVRDVIFYGLLFPFLMRRVQSHYDCGKLPSVPAGRQGKQNK